MTLQVEASMCVCMSVGLGISILFHRMFRRHKSLRLLEIDDDEFGFNDAKGLHRARGSTHVCLWVCL